MSIIIWIYFYLLKLATNIFKYSQNIFSTNLLIYSEYTYIRYTILLYNKKRNSKLNSFLQIIYWRRHPDLNWGIKVLQTSALPLGYSAVYFYYIQLLLKCLHFFKFFYVINFLMQRSPKYGPLHYQFIILILVLFLYSFFTYYW